MKLYLSKWKACLKCPKVLCADVHGVMGKFGTICAEELLMDIDAKLFSTGPPCAAPTSRKTFWLYYEDGNDIPRHTYLKNIEVVFNKMLTHKDLDLESYGKILKYKKEMEKINGLH